MINAERNLTNFGENGTIRMGETHTKMMELRK
jgi:hypothetical protein